MFILCAVFLILFLILFLFSSDVDLDAFDDNGDVRGFESPSTGMMVEL